MSEENEQPVSADQTPADEESATSKAPDPDMASFTGEWPTHGGYLGCLMGMFISVVVAGFLASELISFIHFARQDARIGFIIGAVAVMLVVVVGGGRIGWGLGKRFYRDYGAAEGTGKSPAGH